MNTEIKILFHLDDVGVSRGSIKAWKGPCQRKLGCEGQGSDLASRLVKTQSIQVL